MEGVNLFLHCLIQQVGISLNDVQVSQSSVTYAYRAYIESLLSYGPQEKHTQLTAALFYKDTACDMDRPNSAQGNEEEKNVGLQSASFTDDGATVDMIWCIHSDVFFQYRLILNDINVKVRHVRNNDSLCLMYGEANASNKFKIIKPVLLVSKMQLSPSVFLAHAKALASELAKFIIRRVVCKTIHQCGWKLGWKSREVVYRTTPVKTRNQMRRRWHLQRKLSEEPV